MVSSTNRSKIYKLLEKIYKNPKSSGSYGGLQTLYTEARRKYPSLSRSFVKDWLSAQDTYTLHKQAYRKFKRNKIYVSGIDAQWELDLVDMQKYAKYNKSFRFMLTCIDVFSKYAWAVPLKNKSALEICSAFQKILETGRQPWRVRTDKGKEFVNLHFNKLLRKRGISYFTSQNEDIKCAIVERFNRTLKGRMFRYFTQKKTLKWIDVLDDFLIGYNNSFHRSIKEKPINVTSENEHVVYRNLYPDEMMQNCKFKVGDHVRISKHRKEFQKGYMPQWTEEIFKVYKVLTRRSEPLYRLCDLKDELIEGTFYEKELQKIKFDSSKTFVIEQVFKKRKLADGTVQLFVKWRGYPDKFNEWIDQSDVKK